MILSIILFSNKLYMIYFTRNEKKLSTVPENLSLILNKIATSHFQS